MTRVPMKRIVVALTGVLLGASAIVPAARSQRESLRPAIDNERVTVWDLTAGNSQAPAPIRPCVSIRADDAGGRRLFSEMRR